MKQTAFMMICLVAFVLAFPQPVKADTVSTLLHVSGSTCGSCWAGQTLPNVSFEGTLTVIPGSGMYWHPFFQAFVNGDTALEVIAFTGLLDGQYPIALIPGDQGDGRSWMFSPNLPVYVSFSAGSAGNFRIIWDNAFILFQDRAEPFYMPTAPQVPIMWNASPVPEASSISILAVGFVALMLVKAGTRNWRSSLRVTARR
jgi:hypothetical protein